MIDSPQVINAVLFYKVKNFLVINSTNDVIMPRLKSGFLYLLHPWHWQRWTQHCNIKIRVTISNKTFTELLTFMFWPATYLIYFYSISYIKPDIPFFLNTKEQIPPLPQFSYLQMQLILPFYSDLICYILILLWKVLSKLRNTRVFNKQHQCEIWGCCKHISWEIHRTLVEIYLPVISFARYRQPNAIILKEKRDLRL